MEFTTYINLAPTDGELKAQAIYASQLYGTFFGVFGQFDTKEGSKENKNTRYITNIDFTLINYKGGKNLNIVPDGFSKIETIKTDKGQVIHTLKLLVRCNTENHSQPIQIKVGYELTDYGYPDGFPVKKGDIFMIERELSPMVSRGIDDIKRRAFVNGHFDSEFFQRDGELLMPRRYSEIYDRGERIIDWPGAYPFGSCTPGQSYILF